MMSRSLPSGLNSSGSRKKYGKTSTEEAAKNDRFFLLHSETAASIIDNSFCIWNEESSKLETTEDEEKKL